MDGVLADLDSELVRHAETLFGAVIGHRTRGSSTSAEARAEKMAPATADPAAREDAGEPSEAALENTPPLLKLNLTGRQQRRVWQHVQGVEDFWQTLRELEPGTIERLASLSTERQWEIIFLTKRPQTAGRTAQVQTQRWLEAKGFPLPSVFVVQRSRGRIAAALELDVIVDDRPENCLDVVVDSKARAVLVWREDRKRLPPSTQRLGIDVVGSVSEGLDALTALDKRAAGGSSLIDRVRRLLR
jgi:hypothetical protein